MNHQQLYLMFVEAMQTKTCWGARSVRPLLDRVLADFQEQHGPLPTAGIIINVMTHCVAKQSGWGRNELARCMAFAIRQVEKR